jgi:hypothetical protein
MHEHTGRNDREGALDDVPLVVEDFDGGPARKTKNLKRMMSFGVVEGNFAGMEDGDVYSPD